jgi:hypothetical protein
MLLDTCIEKAAILYWLMLFSSCRMNVPTYVCGTLGVWELILYFSNKNFVGEIFFCLFLHFDWKYDFFWRVRNRTRNNFLLKSDHSIPWWDWILRLVTSQALGHSASATMIFKYQKRHVWFKPKFFIVNNFNSLFCTLFRFFDFLSPLYRLLDEQVCCHMQFNTFRISFN